MKHEMDTQNGALFLKNLAYYVRNHEKALASSAQLQRRPVRHCRATSASTVTTIADGRPSSASRTAVPSTASPSLQAFTNVLRLPSFRIGSSKPKAAKLYLTPNQLYYLLSRFEELGVSVGPMNVRLENIHAESTTSNYVSFLPPVQKVLSKPKDADQSSVHSVSSVKSVMSNMANLWSNLGAPFHSTEKLEKRKAAEMEDLRYLYSAFTKIPYLKLGDDSRIPRIADYEEFPFDSAVPLTTFKNLETLEIVDLDFRSFFGWDCAAEQLRCLILKRAGVDDINDLLTNIVLDDMDRRRRRSSKNPPSPLQTSVASTPGPIRQLDLARSLPTLENLSSTPEGRRHSLTTYYTEARVTGVSARRAIKDHKRAQSRSPSRPATASTLSPKVGMARRSSGSSTSSLHSRSGTTRSSSTNLLLLTTTFPASKWQFLRHLSLADNSLSTINAEALLPIAATLHSLDLSYNLFTEIPEAVSTLASLRALSLAGCKIESLQSLSRSPLPAVEAMNLKGNQITSLAGIEKLLSLERLDIRDNKLKDPSEMARLTVMPSIVEIFITKNPFVKSHENYRVTVFNLFRQTPGYTDDILIDALGPSNYEKRHLVERVRELDAVPVIRPPFDDEPEIKPLSQGAGSIDPLVEELERVQRPTTPTNPIAVEQQQGPPSTASHRKKATKKRVVDMSQPFGSPGSRGSFEVGSPEAAIVTERQSSDLIGVNVDTTPSPNRGASETRSYVLSTCKGSENLPNSHVSSIPRTTQLDITDHSAGSTPGWSGFGKTNEDYRKKIETLKRDYGKDWLTVIGDEHWFNTSAASTQRFGGKDINPSVPFDSSRLPIPATITTAVSNT